MGTVKSKYPDTFAMGMEVGVQNRADYPTQREGESPQDYRDRLRAYCAGMIGLIEAYDHEVTLDRFRRLSSLSKRLDTDVDDSVVQETLNLIRVLQETIESYDVIFPNIAKTRSVRVKRRNLRSKL